MGQAKNRGSFEHRRWLAIEKQNKEESERKFALMEQELKEPRLSRKNSAVLAAMIGMASNIG